MTETITDKQEVSKQEPETVDEAMDDDDEENEVGIPLAVLPQHDKLVTENDEPLNNIFLDKQQRLLVDSLYTSWRNMGQSSPFAAFAKVGVFYSTDEPAFTPDVCLSRITMPKDIMLKKYSAYYAWYYGRSPEVMVEIVTNDSGEEETTKMQAYLRIAVPFYVIFDPLEYLKKGILRVYGRWPGKYEPMENNWLPSLKLGFTVWQGAFEGAEAAWLRLCNKDGRLFLTGAELAQKERLRADKFAAKLRSLGIDPNRL